MKHVSRFGKVLGLLSPFASKRVFHWRKLGFATKLYFSLKYLFVCNLVVIFVFMQNGCLPKPPLHQYGNLRVTITLAEDGVNSKAQADAICLIKVKLTHEEDQLLKEEQFNFTGTNQEVAIDSLYPGVWQLTVTALNNTGKVIFSGAAEIGVEPEEVKNVQLQLTPAPGTLRVGCDISQNPVISQQTKGTLYVYLNTDAGQTKYYPMAPDGNWLAAETSLKEGTYQVKIAIPNVTAAVFVSSYYLVHIRAGEETALNITANSALNLIGVIDSTPQPPAGLKAVYDRVSGEVQITWDPGTEPDLEGYYLYRTNEDGRFARLWVNNSTTVHSPVTDKVSASNFYNNRIGYAVSSYDRGANESLWSDIVYVYK